MNRIWIGFVAAVVSLSAAAGQVVPDRYIVELSGEPAATQTGRLKNLAEHHPAIRAQQRQVGAELEARQVLVVTAIENVANALVVMAPGMTRQQLEQVPGVKRVHPVRRYHLATDHATGLQKMPDAWAQIGGYAMAGKGIRIGILDTGIDVTHPGFTNSDLKMPSGFPQVDLDVNRKYTNGKVILAKNYDPTNADARDAYGHGTAVAMIAAGWPNSGPFGLLIGMAPEAYLCNYKVFPDDGSGAMDSSIIKALDDAVGDGMDVVNLSLGSVLAVRPDLDPLVQAVERVANYGVIVVIAAGNDGPYLNTMGSPGIAKSAITVGNSWNDRVFAGSAVIDGYATFPVVPASGGPYSPASGTLLDVSTLDKDGLGCGALPAGSLANHVALILRGTCTFEVKLSNAQTAGATAALVYATAADPDAFVMSVGTATLPAAMLSNSDGLRVKTQLVQTADLKASISFDRSPVWVNSAKMDSASSNGPSPEYLIKPNLVAVGNSVSTAWTSVDGQSPYLVGAGTSFSAPMVSGAAALLKAARPGLRGDQYRSLLINSSAPFSTDGSNALDVQQGGAGRLDMLAALTSTLTTDIANSSVSYGVGTGPSINQTPIFTVSNIDKKADHITLDVRPIGSGPAPAVIYTTSFDLDGGATKWLGAQFIAEGLTPGAYQGFLVAKSANTGQEMRIPYWYAVPSNVAHVINWMNPDDGTAEAGSTQYIVFRTIDAAGIPVAVDPTVTPGDDSGRVLSLENLDPDIPDTWVATVKLSATAGSNSFTIQVGDFTKEVTIVGH